MVVDKLHKLNKRKTMSQIKSKELHSVCAKRLCVHVQIVYDIFMIGLTCVLVTVL